LEITHSIIITHTHTYTHLLYTQNRDSSITERLLSFQIVYPTTKIKQQDEGLILFRLLGWTCNDRLVRVGIVVRAMQKSDVSPDRQL